MGAPDATEPDARSAYHEGGRLHRDDAGLLPAVSWSPRLHAGLPAGGRAPRGTPDELVLRPVGRRHRDPDVHPLLACRSAAGRSLPPAPAGASRGCAEELRDAGAPEDRVRRRRAGVRSAARDRTRDRGDAQPSGRADAARAQPAGIGSCERQGRGVALTVGTAARAAPLGYGAATWERWPSG